MKRGLFCGFNLCLTSSVAKGWPIILRLMRLVLVERDAGMRIFVMEGCGIQKWEASDVEPICAVGLSSLPDNMQDTFRPLFDFQQHVFALASSSLPQVAIAVSAYSSGQLYRPVNGVELQQNSDGNWTTVIRGDDGKICAHIPLEKNNPLCEAAKMGWALTSLAVGQAHMMTIAAELALINNKLDELKEIEYDKQISAVESAMWAWRKIDFSNDIAFVVMHQDRQMLDEACRNIYKALMREAAGMPSSESPRFFEGWFSSAGNLRPAQAKRRFMSILKLLPVYIKGMLFLVATDNYEMSANFESGCRFMNEVEELVSTTKLLDKSLIVPTIENIGKAPEVIINELIASNKKSRQMFKSITDMVSGGRSILLPI